MSNISEFGDGGANIRPSARRSIHSDGHVYPLQKTMGRYGLQSQNKRPINTSQEDKGSDVVDNAQSKLAQPYESIQMIKAKPRRNSVYDTDIFSQITDNSDNEECKLSQSSPASFTLFHYSSNLDNSDSEERNVTRERSQILQGPHVNQNNRSRHENDIHIAATKIKSDDRRWNQTLVLPCVFIAVVAAIIFKINYVNMSTEIKNNIYNELDFNRDVKILGAKYNVNKNTLLQIKSGISTIFNRQDTASFVFVYNSKSDNYSPTTFNSFMEELVAKTMRYLRNDSQELNHVYVDTKNIQSDVELMDLYREDVDRSGVMVVPNVDRLPSQLAMAFHYYCDEYNPLVKTSAIFFTLDTAACDSFSGDKPTHEYIEKCLSKEWKNIHEDKIGPLLTRIVNIIIDVRNIA